jgi:predicted NBD/HSP70 family sugar kinase
MDHAREPGRRVPHAAGIDHYYAIGIRVTAQRLVGVLVDIDGALVELQGERAGPAGTRRHVQARRLKSTDVATVVADIATLVQELLSVRPGEDERVVGIGVTVGGHVDGRSGTVLHSPNLHWNDVVPLAHLLKQATGLEAVEVENDVNALAVAEEIFGAGRHVEHFAVITVDLDGVGAGLVLNHELYRGVGGLAGELGHIPERGATRCRCGNRGCLETLAGADVIIDHVRQAGRSDVISLDQAAALARQRDELAWNAFERAGEALGRGLAAVVNLLNLGLLIIHTEAALRDERGPYRRAAERTLRAHAFSTAAASCKISWRQRTDELEAQGAASMAFHPLPDVFPQLAGEE